MDINDIYPAMINLAWDTILLVDYPSGRIVDANNNACESLGYTREELLQLVVSDFDHVYDTQKLNELINFIDIGNSTIIESTQIRKDGTSFPVEINVGGHLLLVKESFFLLLPVMLLTGKKRFSKVLQKVYLQLTLKPGQ